MYHLYHDDTLCLPRCYGCSSHRRARSLPSPGAANHGWIMNPLKGARWRMNFTEHQIEIPSRCCRAWDSRVGSFWLLDFIWFPVSRCSLARCSLARCQVCSCVPLALFSACFDYDEPFVLLPGLVNKGLLRTLFRLVTAHASSHTLPSWPSLEFR